MANSSDVNSAVRSDLGQAWANAWHLWRIIIPRRSITGRLVWGPATLMPTDRLEKVTELFGDRENRQSDHCMRVADLRVGFLATPTV
jgi:hypothetical protein